MIHYPTASTHEMDVTIGYEDGELKIFADDMHPAPAILWADLTENIHDSWSISAVYLGSPGPRGASEEMKGALAESAKALLLADDEFIRWADDWYRGQVIDAGRDDRPFITGCAA